MPKLPKKTSYRELARNNGALAHMAKSAGNLNQVLLMELYIVDPKNEVFDLDNELINKSVLDKCIELCNSDKVEAAREKLYHNIRPKAAA